MEYSFCNVAMFLLFIRSFGTDEDLLIVPCLASGAATGASACTDNTAEASAGGLDDLVSGGKGLGQHLAEVSINLPAGINLRSKASRVAT